MHSFTQEDLIQFMYKETSPQKTAAIKAALVSDWTLKEEYQGLQQSQQMLDTFVEVAPRKKALDFILNYAEKKETQSTEV
jgi:uncharacterized protein YchJ